MTGSDERPTASAAEVTRRSVLRGAAVGGMTLPLLAACGSSDGSSSSGSDASSGSGSGSGSGSDGGAKVAAADVPVGGGTVLSSQQVVVTQPAKGEFKAFTAVCTHQGCTVNQVTGGQIVCPCHGSQFSIKDGSVTSGPAPSPLAARKVSVSGGEITVS